MSDLVTYELADGLATLTMDDGKVNAMSIPMLRAVHAAFERAEKDEAIVVLTGREGIFSAGFDLRVFQQGPEATLEMLQLGAELTDRLLRFPRPVVTACNGHAYPMGAFLMLSADLRLGAAGPFRIGMNEVSIALTVPRFAVVLAQHRLAPTHFHRAVVLSEMFEPEDAVAAGFLDRVVPADELLARAREAARDLARLDRTAHTNTKLRTRAATLDALREAIDRELTPEQARAAVS